MKCEIDIEHLVNQACRIWDLIDGSKLGPMMNQQTTDWKTEKVFNVAAYETYKIMVTCIINKECFRESPEITKSMEIL